ncbi:hypothetical protein [Paraflavitalea speifideaquila]|uniref:hypothetical protein n=1 Tax=Paraflavitalea speifideaquila TaxID=3076558 RepID=UPI0028E3A3A4|nr:hypothetical protein [Paraflavitalea speifideiaquila]
MLVKIDFDLYQQRILVVVECRITGTSYGSVIGMGACLLVGMCWVRGEGDSGDRFPDGRGRLMLCNLSRAEITSLPAFDRSYG